jgi:hypothetical protein
MTTMFSRNLLKKLTQLTAGLLLFAQLVQPAQACMLRLQSGPTQTSGEAMAMGECADASMDTAPCLAYCLKADQPANPTVDYHFSVVLPPSTHIPRLPALQQAGFSAILSPTSRCSGSPPLQILFCSFQN